MAYSADMIQQVWEKGRGYSEVDTNEWREDECGAWLHRTDYGKDSEFGWKILNTEPGAPDTVDNLRPFHVRNDYDRAAHKPKRHVTSDRTGLPVFEHLFQPHNRDV